MLEALQKFFDVFGAAIVVPVMIFIVSLFLKVSPKRAFSVPCARGWFDRIWLGHLCFYTAGNQVHPANG